MSIETGRETNEQLVQKIKAGEDVTENMTRLWQQNRNLIYLIVRKYAKTETDIDDLMQEGYLGMCNAVDHYDLSAGVPFHSYASLWIRQGVRRYSQDNRHIHIPFNLQERILKYQRFLNDYKENNHDVIAISKLYQTNSDIVNLFLEVLTTFSSSNGKKIRPTKQNLRNRRQNLIEENRRLRNRVIELENMLKEKNASPVKR